ncbi:MAG: hypothetical protein H6737_16995 [Alphaproteobacteria bacterium]|nr:hypothetical protein [Alphaproteobacteria bacterium]
MRRIVLVCAVLGSLATSEDPDAKSKGPAPAADHAAMIGCWRHPKGIDCYERDGTGTAWGTIRGVEPTSFTWLMQEGVLHYSGTATTDEYYVGKRSRDVLEVTRVRDAEAKWKLERTADPREVPKEP